MEQEGIDREFFELARQHKSFSGLMKVPDHVALPDDVALWKLDSEFPSFYAKHLTRQYACPMRHLCGCMAGIRVTESFQQGWMRMDICGCHDQTSHASKPRNNTKAIKLAEILAADAPSSKYCGLVRVFASYFWSFQAWMELCV